MRHVGIASSIEKRSNDVMYALWTKLWPKKLMMAFERCSTFPNESNPNLQLKKIFVALLHMSLCPRFNLKDYWRHDEYGDPFISKLFKSSVDFLQHLHGLKLTGDNDFNPNNLFWKIQPLIEILNKSFSSTFTPGQLIDVDEHGVPFKGTFIAKQYMKNKPYKWIIKVWMLNDI